MDKLLDLKKEILEKLNVKISINDFIIKAVSKANIDVP